MFISKCKFFFITLSILFGLNIGLNAQVSLGLQGGLNTSTVVVDHPLVQPNISSTGGFTIGGIINYKVSSIISLQSEIRYTQIGNKQEFGQYEIATDNIYYLEIPVYTVAEFPNSFISPFILAGISTGILLNASEKVYSNHFDLTDFYNKTNFTFDIGCGIKHSFYRDISVQLSGRYSHGIYNIEKEFPDRKTHRKTRSFNVLLGVLYSI